MKLDRSCSQTWTSSEKSWRSQEPRLVTLLWSYRAKMWVFLHIKDTISPDCQDEAKSGEVCCSTGIVISVCLKIIIIKRSLLTYLPLPLWSGQKLPQKSTQSAKERLALHLFQRELKRYVTILLQCRCTSRRHADLLYLSVYVLCLCVFAAVCVLEKMLLLDPEQRVSASEALELPFFSEYRDAEEETEALPYDQTIDNMDLQLDQWKRKRGDKMRDV